MGLSKPSISQSLLKSLFFRAEPLLKQRQSEFYYWSIVVQSYPVADMKTAFTVFEHYLTAFECLPVGFAEEWSKYPTQVQVKGFSHSMSKKPKYSDSLPFSNKSIRSGFSWE